MRGQEEGWAININKNLGQLSPMSSSSTSLMQGLETQLLLFFLEGEHLALGLRAHKRPSKRRQKSITRLARNSPAGGWAEAKGQEAIPEGLREDSSRGAQALLVQAPEGLLVPGKGSQGCFRPRKSGTVRFISCSSPPSGTVEESLGHVSGEQ